MRKINKLISQILTFWIPFSSVRKNLRSTVLRYIQICNSKKIQKKYPKILRKIQLKAKRGEKINVCFMMYMSDTCDVFSNLYHLFKNDDMFNVTAVNVPYTYDSKNHMINSMNNSYEYLLKKDIPVINGYDEKNDKFLNMADKFDIVFFQCSYDWLRPEFTVEHFSNALTFCMTYGQFLADNMKHLFSQEMFSELYKIFPQSKKVLKMMKKYSQKEGIDNINDEFLGNPKNEPFFNDKYLADDSVWKKQDTPKKRIIWAPHHVWAKYSNFLEYKDFFVELTKKYENQIQFSFKPHPTLKASLIEKGYMSEEEVNQYYKFWEEGANTQYNNGEWFDLFKASDAMILDSISFMLEYSLTGKPACVQYRTDENNERIMKFNECGEEVFNTLYKAKNKEEIISFIEKVVLNNNDYKKQERDNYIRENYLPPYNKTASENIYKYIKKIIVGE